MARHLLLAVLWGIAICIWVSMARLLVNVPDVGGVAGVVTAAAVIGRGLLLTRGTRVKAPSAQLADDVS